jgi:hypothetical protein
MKKSLTYILLFILVSGIAEILHPSQSASWWDRIKTAFSSVSSPPPRSKSDLAKIKLRIINSDMRKFFDYIQSPSIILSAQLAESINSIRTKFATAANAVQRHTTSHLNTAAKAVTAVAVVNLFTASSHAATAAPSAASTSSLPSRSTLVKIVAPILVASLWDTRQNTLDLAKDMNRLITFSTFLPRAIQRNIRSIIQKANSDIANNTFKYGNELTLLLAKIHDNKMKDAVTIAATAHRGSLPFLSDFTYKDFLDPSMQKALLEIILYDQSHNNFLQFLNP